MAPESERAKEVVRYDHCSKCESAIAQIGHWEHLDKFYDDDHEAHPKSADSWRERRVQELENLLAKHSGCSHCKDSASDGTSANDSTEIREDWKSCFKMLEILTRELFVFGNPHDPKWMAIWKQIFALCKETT